MLLYHIANSKYPIILAPDSHITRLIVGQLHETLMHSGTKITLTELRREFWIPTGRNIVRNFIRKSVENVESMKTNHTRTQILQRYQGVDYKIAFRSNYGN